MLIGIVILNYKTFLDTERLVREILSKPIEHDLMVVVVDNASPNESFVYLNNMFRDWSTVEVIQSSYNGGFAKGNNVGLKYLKVFSPDYALILNNDVHFDVLMLEHLVNMYATLDSPGIISPLQKLSDNEYLKAYKWTCNTLKDDLLSILGLMRFFYDEPFVYNSNALKSNIQCVDIIPGCFIFIDYSLFESINFFDESTFLFCEERLLFKLIQKKNRLNYFILDCFYVHEHSKTINSEVSLIRQKKLLLDGYIIFTKKYRQYPLLKIFLLRFAFLVFFLKTNFKIKIKKFFKL